MNNLVGYDISPDMVRLSLVNMYLHGFSTPKIHEYDTLTSEEKWNETYDVILANPPFMTPKGGIRPTSAFPCRQTGVRCFSLIITWSTFPQMAGVALSCQRASSSSPRSV